VALLAGVSFKRILVGVRLQLVVARLLRGILLVAAARLLQMIYPLKAIVSFFGWLLGALLVLGAVVVQRAIFSSQTVSFWLALAYYVLTTASSKKLHAGMVAVLSSAVNAVETSVWPIKNRNYLVVVNHTHAIVCGPIVDAAIIANHFLHMNVVMPDGCAAVEETVVKRRFLNANPASNQKDLGCAQDASSVLVPTLTANVPTIVQSGFASVLVMLPRNVTSRAAGEKIVIAPTFALIRLRFFAEA